MNCQNLFSQKNKKYILKCCLLKFLPRVLRYFMQNVSYKKLNTLGTLIVLSFSYQGWTTFVRPKKKLLDSQALFSKNRCVFFFFWFGTVLDIWVCMAKQNGGGKNRKYLKCKFKVSNNINRS